jgi:hypothetical protein
MDRLIIPIVLTKSNEAIEVFFFAEKFRH